MKHSIQKYLIAILLASAIFASCSKDESLTAASGSVTKAVKTEKSWPVHFGGIMGSFSPAPLEVVMKLYDDKGNFYADVPVDEKVKFKLENIFPGQYVLIISYVSSADSPDLPVSKNLTLKITVDAGVMNELGVIRLP